MRRGPGSGVLQPAEEAQTQLQSGCAAAVLIGAWESG